MERLQNRRMTSLHLSPMKKNTLIIDVTGAITGHLCFSEVIDKLNPIKLYRTATMNKNDLNQNSFPDKCRVHVSTGLGPPAESPNLLPERSKSRNLLAIEMA